MDRQVHYELFVRHTPGASWKLEMASEDRAQVVDAAETLFATGRVAAVRVTKEVLDPETREFQSSSVLAKGQPDAIKRKPPPENREPLCVAPSDLYSMHARDRIGRLLEAWLARNRATPFELLHRADLVEKLEAAGNELQHAVQKIAVPEAQARGISVHELIRSFQGLIERSVNRVLGDSKKGRFPDIGHESFAAAAIRVCGDPEGAYLLGGAVAGRLSGAASWSAKVEALLDLAEAAPQAEDARRLAFFVLEQPLSEILESKSGLIELLGDVDLGGQLAAMTRLAAEDTVTTLSAVEPLVGRCIPALTGPAARLAHWLAQPPFADTRAAVARRVLRELMGPRRLRPKSPKEEIELLRALGMALAAASGKLIPPETVQEAFAARSHTLVTSEFVESLIGQDRTVREEAEVLIWLAENVVGAVNKRAAARYLNAHLCSLRCETELRAGHQTPSARLAALAAMQRNAGRAGLVESDLQPIQAKLGELGGLIEADAKLVATVVQASAPVFNRLNLLLRLAAGEAAPLGPAADRARAAAMKMIRSDQVRAELAQQPEQLAQVRDIIQAVGAAA
ncbi:MAG TPA: hypothetical protein VME40_08995 [Caulobacteraceae bacterium]|nr:hypothetical protein [Caulobacteraceae bacterium]